MRAFVGSLLAADKQTIWDDDIQRLVTGSHGLLRAIPRRSAHLTFAFLGEIDTALVPDVVSDISAVASGLTPIAIRFAPPHILYAGRDARLVTAGITTGDRAIASLATRLVERFRRRPQLAHLDAAKAPHLTLARFRKGVSRTHAKALEPLLSDAADTPRARDETIERVQVIRSELTPAGPVYYVLQEIRLGEHEPTGGASVSIL